MRRSRFGQSRDEAQGGDKQDVRVQQARRRITRQPEERFPFDQAKRGRLSRLHRDAVKEHLAAGARARPESNRAHPPMFPREHENIVRQALVDGTFEIGDRVGCGPIRDRQRPMLCEHGGDG